MPDFSKEALVNKGGTVVWLPPGHWSSITAGGVWTESYDDVTNLYRVRRARGAAATEIVITGGLLGQSRTTVGMRLRAVELNYVVSAMALDAVTLTVLRYNTPADTVAATSTSLAFAYDAAHDTAAERSAVGNHSLVGTLNTPTHLDLDEAIMLRVLVDDDAGADADFDWRSAVLHFEQERG